MGKSIFWCFFDQQSYVRFASVKNHHLFFLERVMNASGGSLGHPVQRFIAWFW